MSPVRATRLKHDMLCFPTQPALSIWEPIVYDTTMMNPGVISFIEGPVAIKVPGNERFIISVLILRYYSEAKTLLSWINIETCSLFPIFIHWIAAQRPA